MRWAYYEAEVAQVLPLNALSRGFGAMANITIPKSMRSTVYSAYGSAFGCLLEEAAEPLENYPSLGAFFTRKLKQGVRSISTDDLVSPVDGTVLHFGQVTSPEAVEQIKGVSYSVKTFLGESDPILKKIQEKKSNIYHCVIYLGPGDYHGIHSPASWNINKRVHFPGLFD
jgi:phosphatidylserine decarboxylase